MFSIIVATGKHNEIGKKGQLIFNIKEDMKFFKNTTLNHTVVMGNKTWESLPAKLKNRTNVVISYNPVPGADQTITDLPTYIDTYKDTDEEIFVIGGGTIYRAFLPYAKHLYITEVDASDEEADTFFPDFDRTKYQKTILKHGTSNGLNYDICKYTLEKE